MTTPSGYEIEYPATGSADSRVETLRRGHRLQRLDGRCQRRGVGQGSAEDTGRGRPAEGEQADRDADRHGCRRRQGGEDEEVRAQSAPAQRSEEAGPARQPDRVDEQREPEHPDGVGKLQPRVDRAGADAGEQHGGHAEREPEDADLPEQEAGSDDQEEDQNRVVGERVDHALSIGAMRSEAIRKRPDSGCGSNADNVTYPSAPAPTVQSVPQWIVFLVVAIGAWFALSVGGGLLVGRLLSLAARRRPHPRLNPGATEAGGSTAPTAGLRRPTALRR
jgi:hypothetical protein